MKRIKIALVGCGRIGLHHAQLIAANPKLELVGLCDAAARPPLSAVFSNIPFFHSLAELLAAPVKPELVSIATPNGMHEQNACEAMLAGCDVIIEKPMAPTAEACRRILQVAEENNRRVFCIMQNRFSAPARWLTELREKDLLGDPFFLQVNCFWNRDERYYTGHDWHGDKTTDGGTLFTQFSHFIDTIYWLFGELQPVLSQFGNFTHGKSIAFEDTGTVSFRFGKRGIGNINFSTSAVLQNAETSFTLLTDKATLRIEGQYFDTIAYSAFTGGTNPPAVVPVPVPEALKNSGLKNLNHYLVFDQIADALNGLPAAVTDGKEGLRVVEIIEQMYAAALQK